MRFVMQKVAAPWGSFCGLENAWLLVLNRPAFALDSEITSWVFARHFAISGAQTETPHAL
jgi:hypothetical protein